MKNILCLLVLIVMVSCNHGAGLDSQFELIDSLIVNENSDSAYSILKQIKPEIENMSESERMKYHLFLATVSNVLEIELPSDSDFFEVVNYYDIKGTANEQMKAHYLLGCIYRDMHEFPVALQCYYDAIEKADTLSSNCDFLSLMCIWGQIGTVLNDQCMPHDEINAWKQYSKYAEKANLHYEAIHGYELLIRPYYTLGDTAKIFEITETAAKMYKEKGYDDCAGQVYGRSIEFHLEKGDYAKAKEQMDMFESEPGFYLPDGSINDDRNMYYYYKGLYALGMRNMSEAEYDFRLLKKYRINTLSYKGLLRYYRIVGNVDSIIKYSFLFEKELRNQYAGINVEAMENVVGMYDYSRYQRLAEQRLYKIKLHLTFGIIAFLIIIIFLIYFYFYYNRAMNRNSSTLKATIANHEEYKFEKEEEISHMREEIERLQMKIEEERRLNDFSAFVDTDIVQQLIQQYDLLSSADQEKFIKVIKAKIPHFYNKTFLCSSLTQKEQMIAMFVLLNFPLKQIASLVGLNTVQQVTNIKKRISIKLGHGEESTSLFDILLSLTLF